jgi:predicted Rossmann fold nucleotide-binding protein DprA/Smf involved in DNA uptake
MELSRDTQAVLLLTAYLSKAGQEPATPLKPREWAQLVGWLHNRGATPADFLDGRDSLVEASRACGFAPDRLRGLLERGFALAHCAERWQRAGIWFLTRASTAYPERFKQRLGTAAPPVLFGCGHQRILETRGLAVVGSRNATAQDLNFTSRLAERTAADGYTVISGGARGVDTTAMEAALVAEGTAVGVLADSLMRASTSRIFRPHLAAGNLVLISPYQPEARFNVGNAMRRNALIYTLADAAVVIASDEGKGGTWNGATEALNAGWGPVWVRTHAHMPSGNAALIKRGAQPLEHIPETLDSLRETEGAGMNSRATTLLDWSEPQDAAPAQGGETNAVAVGPRKADDRAGPPSQSASDDRSRPLAGVDTLRHDGSATHERPPEQMNLSLYELFVEKSIALLKEEELNAKEIAEKLDLTKKQVEYWLRRATQDGYIVRHRGTRIYYAPAREDKRQNGLFE